MEPTLTDILYTVDKILGIIYSRRWRSGLERSLYKKQKVGCSNPSRDRPKL